MKAYRIYFANTSGLGPFVTLKVMKTEGAMKRVMYADYRRRFGKKVADDSRNWFNGVEAACVGWTHKVDGVETEDFGVIYLNDEKLAAGVVAHECLHATFNWAARYGIDPRNSRVRKWDALESQKEQFHHVFNWLVDQAWDVVVNQPHE